MGSSSRRKLNKTKRRTYPLRIFLIVATTLVASVFIEQAIGLTENLYLADYSPRSKVIIYWVTGILLFLIAYILSLSEEQERINDSNNFELLVHNVAQAVKDEQEKRKAKHFIGTEL